MVLMVLFIYRRPWNRIYDNVPLRTNQETWQLHRHIVEKVLILLSHVVREEEGLFYHQGKLRYKFESPEPAPDDDPPRKLAEFRRTTLWDEFNPHVGGHLLPRHLRCFISLLF